MLEIITSVNTALNNFIWGVPAMVCIIGVGLYLSLRTGFLQIRKFGYSLKCTIGRIFRKREASEGAITPFQAVCTALAATVGTGNIAGVAGAIAIGGPGAVFWMWISALLGMCTKFAEVTLAVHFRERNVKGDYVGGPMYYIKNGLGKKWMWLAYLYAFFGVCAVFGTGNATQVNTITAAVNTALINYGLLTADSVRGSNLIIGIFICIIVALILIGGVKRIGRVSEKLVPIMALLYIILGIGLIVMKIDRVPAVFASIIQGAFNPAAITGGIVGSFHGLNRALEQIGIALTDGDHAVIAEHNVLCGHDILAHLLVVRCVEIRAIVRIEDKLHISRTVFVSSVSAPGDISDVRCILSDIASDIPRILVRGHAYLR